MVGEGSHRDKGLFLTDSSSFGSVHHKSTPALTIVDRVMRVIRSPTRPGHSSTYILVSTPRLMTSVAQRRQVRKL